MKTISIEEYVYKISNKDWELFEKIIQDAGYNTEKFQKALEFIQKKYTPIIVLDGRYNY